MTFSSLGVLHGFLAYNIFNLWNWIHNPNISWGKSAAGGYSYLGPRLRQHFLSLWVP